MTQNAVALTPAPGKTRLITSADDKQILSDNRETDCRTALTRGLKEYLEQLSIEMSGRQLRLATVVESWAEPILPAKYPGACVYGAEAGSYDWTRFSPKPQAVGRRTSRRAETEAQDGVATSPAQGLDQLNHIFFASEYVADLIVEIYTTDPTERVAMVAMMEDASVPVDWMMGFRLELPHYFNIRATYEHKTLEYVDVADDNQKRWRIARFGINGKVTHVKRVGAQLPKLDIRTSYEVE